MDLRLKASKSEPEDYISNMPENVITSIMDRLPLQDAVRTSILSSNWRFKWTKLSQLVLDDTFFYYLSKTKDQNNFGRIVSRLLLHLQGVITKLVLCYQSVFAEDINHWIAFLSKKGLKDLTIRNSCGAPFKLPTRVFSCLELKHLKLYHCCFDPPTRFHGFPNLLSLELSKVQFESGKLGEFCPALEMLKMGSPYQTLKVKSAEIGKLANLKILSLFMSNLDNTSLSSIIELVGFLPKLQELDLDFLTCKDTVLTPGVYFPKVDYSTTRLLQLWRVVFRDLKGSENEVCLIKYLLACSPLLKKLVIHPHSRQVPGEFVGKLLKLQRAYPKVDIDLY